MARGPGEYIRLPVEVPGVFDISKTEIHFTTRPRGVRATLTWAWGNQLRPSGRSILGLVDDDGKS